MQIMFNKADFDGACEFLAAHNPVYDRDPNKVADCLRRDLGSFRDERTLGLRTGGYHLIREYDEDDEPGKVFVSILIRAGVQKPFKVVVASDLPVMAWDLPWDDKTDVARPFWARLTSV